MGDHRGGAIPMRSLRLVPYWSVHETLGVDAHNAPLKMRTRRIHLSRAVLGVAFVATRSPVPHWAARTWRGATPLRSTDLQPRNPPLHSPVYSWFSVAPSPRFQRDGSLREGPLTGEPLVPAGRTPADDRAGLPTRGSIKPPFDPEWRLLNPAADLSAGLSP